MKTFGIVTMCLGLAAFETVLAQQADGEGNSRPPETARPKGEARDSSGTGKAKRDMPELTDFEKQIILGKGTERAFTGKYDNHYEKGTYVCRQCGAALYRSDSKFKSGCGWPSFFQPADESNILEERDTTHGMIRTEVMCKKCGAHLGHVFEDGPAPTGLRYCINSLSVKLDPKS